MEIKRDLIENMRDKLLLLKSTINKSCHDRIWWTYNYGAESDNQIPNYVEQKLSESLNQFIDEVYENYEQITEEKLHLQMKVQVEKLCLIYPMLMENEEGLYDYGGLNDFFIDIVQCFFFYDKKKYRNDVDMLFDCLNGKPIIP